MSGYQAMDVGISLYCNLRYDEKSIAKQSTVKQVDYFPLCLVSELFAERQLALKAFSTNAFS
jgi:hypothetical protein